MIRRFRTITFGALAATTLLIAAACGGSESVDEAEKLFEAPPWQGEESYVYQLSTRGEDNAGTCTLVTEPEFEPGRTKLSRLCENGPYRDDGVAIVESQTLQPFSAERVVFDGEKNRRTIYTNTYRETDVLFEADVDGKLNDTTRDLPTPTDRMPDPGWYEDESLLWLARGIPLRKGFEGTYAHVINAGLPRLLEVDVVVEGPEKVEAGDQEYEAWHVQFRRSDNIYRVWVETGGVHRVVRAQIEDVVYELIPEGSVAQP